MGQDGRCPRRRQGPRPAHAALRQGSGKSTGKDIAIIGFDDIAEASLVMPALTTVAVDAEALGEHAARLLLDQIRTGTSAAGSYVGDARLIVRGTCGASRGGMS